MTEALDAVVTAATEPFGDRLDKRLFGSSESAPTCMALLKDHSSRLTVSAVMPKGVNTVPGGKRGRVEACKLGSESPFCCRTVVP